MESCEKYGTLIHSERGRNINEMNHFIVTVVTSHDDFLVERNNVPFSGLDNFY